MNAKQLIEFLGHSSIHESFDDFLLANGIKKRPKGNEVTISVADKPLGISMEFQAANFYDEEHIQKKKSDGKFILKEVTFQKQPESTLPYGISFKLSVKQASDLLGPAKKETVLPTATYFFDEKIIVIRREQTSNAISSISFSLPDIYDKQHLKL